MYIVCRLTNRDGLRRSKLVNFIYWGVEGGGGWKESNDITIDLVAINS